MKTLPIERNIVNTLQIAYNPKMKLKNLMEWSTDEKTIDKNLKDGETKVLCCEVWCAVNLPRTIT